MFVTLPVLVALSWTPSVLPAAPAAPAAPHAARPAQTAETVTCPLTGEQIPACCCPVKK